MSIRATNFGRRLRGLTPNEKLVTMIAADHEHHQTGEISVSMSTLAAEAGFKSREGASGIMNRLVDMGLFSAQEIKGKAKTHRLNYDWQPVTAQSHLPVNNQSHLPVNAPVNVEEPTCERGPVENARPVNGQPGTCERPVTQRVLREKKERENLEGFEGHTLTTSASRPNGFASGECERQFKIFWNAYPRGRRLNPESARREWRKLQPQDWGVAQENLELWKCHSGSWSEESGRYAPKPAKFLREGYWKEPPPEYAEYVAAEQARARAPRLNAIEKRALVDFLQRCMMELRISQEEIRNRMQRMGIPWPIPPTVTEDQLKAIFESWKSGVQP